MEKHSSKQSKPFLRLVTFLTILSFIFSNIAFAPLQIQQKPNAAQYTVVNPLLISANLPRPEKFVTGFALPNNQSSTSKLRPIAAAETSAVAELMKSLGPRDENTEKIAKQLGKKIPDFIRIVDDLPPAERTPRDHYGTKAIVIEADLGKEGAYSFFSTKYDCLIIVVNSQPQYSEAIQKEGIFHEAKADYWIQNGFTPEKAHIIASAFQEIEFSEGGKLTPYHLAQLKNMTDDQLRAIIQEKESARGRHHWVLEEAIEKRPGLDLRNFIEFIKTYENNLRAFAQNLLTTREEQRQIDLLIEQVNADIGKDINIREVPGLIKQIINMLLKNTGLQIKKRTTFTQMLTDFKSKAAPGLFKPEFELLRNALNNGVANSELSARLNEELAKLPPSPYTSPIAQPRKADGTFAQKPGGSPEEVWQTIKDTPELQTGDGFALRQFKEFHLPKLPAGSTLSDETIRSDLDKLIEEGILGKTGQRGVYYYYLTKKAKYELKRIPVESVTPNYVASLKAELEHHRQSLSSLESQEAITQLVSEVGDIAQHPLKVELIDGPTVYLIKDIIIDLVKQSPYQLDQDVLPACANTLGFIAQSQNEKIGNFIGMKEVEALEKAGIYLCSSDGSNNVEARKEAARACFNALARIVQNPNIQRGTVYQASRAIHMIMSDEKAHYYADELGKEALTQIAIDPKTPLNLAQSAATYIANTIGDERYETGLLEQIIKSPQASKLIDPDSDFVGTLKSRLKAYEASSNDQFYALPAQITITRLVAGIGDIAQNPNICKLIDKDITVLIGNIMGRLTAKDEVTLTKKETIRGEDGKPVVVETPVKLSTFLLVLDNNILPACARTLGNIAQSKEIYKLITLDEVKALEKAGIYLCKNWNTAEKGGRLCFDSLAFIVMNQNISWSVSLAAIEAINNIRRETNINGDELGLDALTEIATTPGVPTEIAQVALAAKEETFTYLPKEEGLGPYTGAGDTAIHKALDDIKQWIKDSKFNLAKNLLNELIRDLRAIKKTPEGGTDTYETIMTSWNERYPSELPVDLLRTDVPVALEEAEKLLVRCLILQIIDFSDNKEPPIEVANNLQATADHLINIAKNSETSPESIRYLLTTLNDLISKLMEPERKFTKSTECDIYQHARILSQISTVPAVYSVIDEESFNKIGKAIIHLVLRIESKQESYGKDAIGCYIDTCSNIARNPKTLQETIIIARDTLNSVITDLESRRIDKSISKPRKDIIAAVIAPINITLRNINRILVQRATTKNSGVEPPQPDLGAEVANVKSLGNLLHILNALRKSEDFPSITEKSSNREIIEFLITELEKQHLIEESLSLGLERVYLEERRLIKIKDEAKETPIGRAIQEWVINPEGGVKAINFKGKDDKWVILGFASELNNPATMEHELKEVYYRQLGFDWIDAHNMTVVVLNKGEGMINKDAAMKLTAGKQNEIGAGGEAARREHNIVQEQALAKIEEITGKVDTKILDNTIRMEKIFSDFNISLQSFKTIEPDGTEKVRFILREKTGLVVSINAVAEGLGAVLVGLANRGIPIYVVTEKDNKAQKQLLDKLNKNISVPVNKIQTAYSFGDAASYFTSGRTPLVDKITLVVTDEEAEEANKLAKTNNLITIKIAKNIIEALGQIKNMKDILEDFKVACVVLGLV